MAKSSPSAAAAATTATPAATAILLADGPNASSTTTTTTTPAQKDEPEPEEEEEDYMSMPLPSPPPHPPLQQETYTQRRERKAREALAAQPKPKSEIQALANAARDAALATALPAESRGAKMMARLGYKPGGALGAAGNPHARVEPIGVEVREDGGERAGVGMESERKRKMRERVEMVERGEKRVKAEETGYRERVAREREEKRVEGLWWGAMKVLEGLEEDEEDEAEEEKKKKKGLNENGGVATSEEEEVQGRENQNKTRTKTRTKRKKKVNVLYRPLVKQREGAESDRSDWHNLMQSLSRDRKYEDPEEDEQERLAFSRDEVDGCEEEEAEEIEGEVNDKEFADYMAQEPKERLARVVTELRGKWWYCFWCKSRYEDAAMEECPGPEEEEHD